MRRRLVLVRHSKTEQGEPDLARALTERGRRDARAIGRWLADNDITPDLAVVSPSVRTRQTWQVAAAELTVAPPSTEDPRIYDNTVQDVLAVARSAGDSVGSLVLVGHNPSMHGCAIRLAGDAGDQVREFPTSAVAVFDIDGEWPDTGRPAATLVAVTTCRG
jgi:phosphohistidine phosphatase